ncbi:hypothetical protein MUK42_18588 [Musa troglodytarum]|uniref:Uncharacterized protein n=1 Tax=Musa troglodytarum TaxID=320322 RepID=A0A9E7JE64_9LILI|nr:hypothetical protein MUK42_18588 [Musa troglodytarum]
MLRQFSVLPPPPLPSRSPPLRPVPRLLLPSDGFSLYLLHSRRRRRRRPLVIVLRSGGGDRWRLTDLDPNAVQDRLRSWLLKARTLLTEVATPLVKPGQGRKLATARELENMDVEEEVFVASEMTVDRRTTNGFLSFAAVVSIEQFARMNGLTGRKMQKIFEALAPETIRTDARSLVEYCCFRYLSRDSSDIHPSLKEHAFQRLIFVTMLAWEQPYTRDGGSQILQDASSFQRELRRDLTGDYKGRWGKRGQQTKEATAVSDGATNKGSGGGCSVSLRRQIASAVRGWGPSFELGHISWFD